MPLLFLRQFLSRQKPPSKDDPIMIPPRLYSVKKRDPEFQNMSAVAEQTMYPAPLLEDR